MTSGYVDSIVGQIDVVRLLERRLQAAREGIEAARVLAQAAKEQAAQHEFDALSHAQTASALERSIEVLKQNDAKQTQ